MLWSASRVMISLVSFMCVVMKTDFVAASSPCCCSASCSVLVESTASRTRVSSEPHSWAPMSTNHVLG
eukprot:6623606-Pyramimonas_sp.AAC.1